MPECLPVAMSFRLPSWLRAAWPALSRRRYADDAARMRLAIRLAARNVRTGSGGPFGAAVFERRTGRLMAAGVNLVVRAHCSSLHAELVALALAQRRLRTHDLAAAGDYELHTSVAPCAMCLGAVTWSGVRRLVCAARGADAEALGFDEGAKPPDWPAALRARGIRVRADLLRAEARAVLRLYASRGGAVYTPRRDCDPHPA